MCARPRDKEDSIIEAALAVFSQRGYHAATVEDIAQEAGVGKGTIYEYFKGKEQLFEKIIQRGINQYASIVEEGLDSVQHPVEKLRKFIEVSVAFFQEHRNASRFISNQVDQPIHHCTEMKGQLMMIRNRILEHLKVVFDEGIKMKLFIPKDSYQMAAIFFGMAVQINFFGMSEENVNLEEYALLLFGIFLRGIAIG